MSDDVAAESKPSLLGRYAVPVVLGTLLGVGFLFLLSRFVQPPTLPSPSGVDDTPALLGDNPGVIVEVPEPRKPLDDTAAEGGEAHTSPAPCPDDVETVDCLLATLDSQWRVVVATESPAGETPTVQAPVAGRLRWPVVSERGGLVTSFVVEADGSLLLIYPSPAGNSPEAKPGVQFDVPRAIDTAGMKWNRPGSRRVFVLISTVPFVAPDGLAAGRVATFYGAGEAAESFFRSLRQQVHADQSTGEGRWAVGEVLFQVVEGG